MWYYEFNITSHVTTAFLRQLDLTTSLSHDKEIAITSFEAMNVTRHYEHLSAVVKKG